MARNVSDREPDAGLGWAPGEPTMTRKDPTEATAAAPL